MGVRAKPRTKRELEEAFDHLYTENEQKVFSLAWRFTGSREAAEDIRQKTFLTLHTKLEQVLDHPKPKGWLFQTMYHFIQSYWREQAYRAEHEVVFEDTEQVPARQSVDELREFLDSLPPWLSDTERKMLTLYYYYGYSLREISTKLGVTYTAIRARMSRLHAKLRKQGWDPSG